MPRNKSSGVTFASFIQAAKELAGIAEPQPKRKKKRRAKPSPNSPSTKSSPPKPSASARKPVENKSSSKPKSQPIHICEAPSARCNNQRYKNAALTRHTRRSRELSSLVDDEDHITVNAVPVHESYVWDSTAPEIVPQNEVETPQNYQTQNVPYNGIEDGELQKSRYAERHAPIIHNSIVFKPTETENEISSKKENISRRKQRRHNENEEYEYESSSDGRGDEDIEIEGVEKKKSRKSSKRRGKRDKHKRDRKKRRHRGRDHAPLEYHNDCDYHPSGAHFGPHSDAPFRYRPPSIPIPLGQPVGPLTEYGAAYLTAQEEHMRKMQERALREEEEYQRSERRRSRSRRKRQN